MRSVGVKFGVTGLTAARHPTGRHDADGHAAAACGAEARWIQRAPATGALEGRLAAAGAVGGHGLGHVAADQVAAGQVAAGQMAGADGGGEGAVR